VAIPLFGRIVIVLIEAHRLAELTHALAERPRHLRETLWAEHHQRNGPQEQQVYWALDSHKIRLARQPADPARTLMA
jgi:hypothetical protein